MVDFGGVLTTSLIDAFRAFCEREGVDFERLIGLLRTSYDEGHSESPMSLVETGRIPSAEFERRMAGVLSEGLHRPIAADGLVSRMMADLKPDDRMLEAVRRVREAGIPTALCSNSWDTAHYADNLRGGLFDVVVISGEVGLRKPDPEIFQLTADRLGLPPAACVFVDDHPANVRAAERVGMVGVHHRNADDTIGRLEALLGVALDGSL